MRPPGLCSHTLKNTLPSRWVDACQLGLAAIVGLSLPAIAMGQTSYYWSGDGANGNFRTTGNFKDAATGGNNLVPPKNSTATRLVFGSRAAAQTTATNGDQDFDLNGIAFEAATDGSGTTFTISGSRLQFQANGGVNPIIAQNSSQAHTISADLRLNAPLTLGGDGAGLLTLSGSTTANSSQQTLTKTGSSAFLLTGNAGAITTTISGGTLALGGAGAVGLIELRGGVLAQAGTFSRTLGTTATNVNFGAGGGGFAAYGGDLTVSTNLGTWGATANSLQAGTALILGSRIATHRVNLTQNIDLGGAARTISLVDNANSLSDVARISGILSNGGLTVNGSGVLELTGTNTYAGVTTIDGGTVSVATIGNGGVAGNLGQASNAAGNLVLGGGTLQYTGASASTDRSFTLTAGTASTIDVTANELTISGASANTSGSLVKAGAGILTLTGANAHSGTTSVNGGVLQLGNGTASGALNAVGAIQVGAGATLRINQSDTVTQGTDFSAAAITGAGKLEQSGTGILVLNAANTYAGGTVVNSGTLLADNTGGSATGSGSVTVKNSGTLGGTGAIAGNTLIESGGTLRAGDVAGDHSQLDFGGDLTLASGSTWLVDLAQDGTSVDNLSVAGTLDLGGSLNIVGSGLYTPGSSYTIASYGSLSGRFSNDLVSNGSNLLRFGRIDAGDGKYWQVDYEDSGHITLQAVPEVMGGWPAGIVIALGGLLRRRRRSRVGGKKGRTSEV